MKRLCNILLIVCLLSAQKIYAQSLAVNTDGSTANTSSILDIKSTDKGILIPRMSKTEKNAIASPATGLMIYQNAPDSIGFHYYNGTQWLWIDPTFKATWKLTGNSGTNSNTHFFGTTDYVPLSWRQDNRWIGRWDNYGRNYYIGDSAGAKTTPSPGFYGHNNVAIGTKALMENTTGQSNIAIGYAALENHVTGGRDIGIGDSTLYTQSSALGLTENVAIGFRAMRNNNPIGASEGFFNTAVGSEALYNNTNGIRNVAIGKAALYSRTTERENTAVGTFAGRDGTDGSYNSFFGYQAAENINGDYNSVFGYKALYSATTGVQNAVFGANAMMNANTSSYNTVFGMNGMLNHKSGDHNTFIGYLTGYQDTSGTQNVAVGSNALMRNLSGSNNTAVGMGALANDTASSPQTAVGAYALGSSKFGLNNVAVGYSALMNSGTGTAAGTQDGGYNVGVGSKTLYSNTIGYRNVSVGDSSMLDNTSGADNVSIGSAALFNNATGNGNTTVGSRAGIVNTTGSNNTYIGYKANSSNNSFTNATAIGANAYVSVSNALVLGSVNGVNAAIASVRVGIGTTLPSRRLHVVNNGTSGGPSASGAVAAIFENDASNFIQLSNPNNSDAGIYSGNVSTAIRSRMVFAADSSIFFGTGGTIVRMTIDNTGQVGVGTNSPVAKLDVDGNFKMGSNGTTLNEIIKAVEVYDIPNLAPGAVDLQVFTISNATAGSIVSVSPLTALPDGITISYARVSSTGNVEVKFVNAGNAAQNPNSNAFYFAIIR